MHLLLYVPAVPQMTNKPKLQPSTTSIVVSWMPPQLIPDNYRISYSCELLCDPQLASGISEVAEGRVTTQTIYNLNPGNRCTINVTAVFDSMNSNTIINSTNTGSAGTVDWLLCAYITSTHKLNTRSILKDCPLHSSYWCS